jgi:predicted N-acetyltransferase YhbS
MAYGSWEGFFHKQERRLNMVIYERGRPGDEPEILDLANYAFSRHRFHDFRALLPKVYGAGRQYSDMHLVARKNNKICGLVATLQQEMLINRGTQLKTGYVGTVCVHPYMQGEGHMTSLMNMAVDNARSSGLDMLVLGGQRQRYQYAGFERGGIRITFSVNKHNISHALKSIKTDSVRLTEVSREDDAGLDICFAYYSRQIMMGKRPRDLFHSIMQSWNGKLFSIYKDNTPAGYIYACGVNIEEMALEDEVLLREVIKSWHNLCGESEFCVTAPMHMPARIAGLQAFSESFQITDAEMLHVFNWQKVIEALLVLKSLYTRLADGRMVIEITDTCRISVTIADNRVTVIPAVEAPHIKVSPISAVTMFFSPIAIYSDPTIQVNNWFPLPFATPMADQF